MNYLDKTGLTRLWSKITSKLGQKQDVLVSGTNIKTINNQSLLGNGNINISGGEGGASTDVQINGSSIVSNDVANIITKGIYDSVDNKIATMSDVGVEFVECNLTINGETGSIEFSNWVTQNIYDTIDDANDAGKIVMLKANLIYPGVGVMQHIYLPQSSSYPIPVNGDYEKVFQGFIMEGVVATVTVREQTPNNPDFFIGSVLIRSGEAPDVQDASGTVSVEKFNELLTALRSLGILYVEEEEEEEEE